MVETYLEDALYPAFLSSDEDTEVEGWEDGAAEDEDLDGDLGETGEDDEE